MFYWCLYCLQPYLLIKKIKPEIYLEKSLKKYKNFKQNRLKIVKFSIGKEKPTAAVYGNSKNVDINHTLNEFQHKKKLAKFETVIKTIFLK